MQRKTIDTLQQEAERQEHVLDAIRMQIFYEKEILAYETQMLDQRQEIARLLQETNELKLRLDAIAEKNAAAKQFPVMAAYPPEWYKKARAGRETIEKVLDICRQMPDASLKELALLAETATTTVSRIRSLARKHGALTDEHISYTIQTNGLVDPESVVIA